MAYDTNIRHKIFLQEQKRIRLYIKKDPRLVNYLKGK